MAATFTWNILGTTCIPNDQGYEDVVNSAIWVCEGLEAAWNETIYSAKESNTSYFAYTPGNPYIPRDQLTTDIILNWVWSGGVDKTAVEAQVQAQIDAQIPPQPPQP